MTQTAFIQQGLKLVLLLSSLGGISLGALDPHKKIAKFIPPAGTRLLFIGQDTQTIQEYLQHTSISPSGFMTYTSIQQAQGLGKDSPDYGSGVSNASSWTRKYPHSCLQIGLYMVDGLEDTLRGKYDTQLRAMAKKFKQWQMPVFLRIGYEFDGSHNHYEPKSYQAAYRYVHDFLTSRNVTNVAFVWHANASDPALDLSPWYPGEVYVDWVGLSYFDQPEDFMQPTLDFAKKHNHPLMIAEATPKGIGVHLDTISWKAWYRLLFDFMERHDIRILSYINSNWEAMPMWSGQGWEDARIQANATILEKWQQTMQDGSWLLPKLDLHQKLNYEP